MLSRKVEPLFRESLRREVNGWDDPSAWAALQMSRHKGWHDVYRAVQLPLHAVARAAMNRPIWFQLREVLIAKGKA